MKCQLPSGIIMTRRSPLASLFLTDEPQDIIDEAYCFCEAVGLPTSLVEIGLLYPSVRVLLRAAEAACAEDEAIRNEPMPLYFPWRSFNENFRPLPGGSS